MGTRSPSLRPFSAALPALLLASGCGGTGAGAPGSSTVAEHMYAHYREVGRVQTAILLGDVNQARPSARWLAGHDMPRGFPAASSPYVETMRLLAREVSAATDVDHAARATAAMGGTCGACHAALGVGPEFGMDAPPSPDESHPMVRHLWAADRLWAGLIGPSEDSWWAGARALASTPFFEDRVGPGGESAVRDLRRLAGEADRAGAREERVRIYGEVLTTCARCHQLHGVAR